MKGNILGSGGGQTKLKNVGIQTGSSSLATSPEAASQIGQSTNFPKKPVETGLGNRSRVPLGNSLTNNVGAGSPGAGRVLYGQGGSQSTYGPVAGTPRPQSRDFLGGFGPEKSKG